MLESFTGHLDKRISLYLREMITGAKNMKRIIKNRIVGFALAVVGVIIMLAYLKNTSVAFEKMDQVVFFTENHAEEEYFLTSRFDFVVQCIRANESVSGQISLGKPISIIGTTALYAPVYNDGKCRWIITVGKKDGDFFINWRKGFADILNELESGRYYFKLEDNGDTYIIGAGRKILIDSEYNRDQIGTILPNDSEIINTSEMQFVNISDSVWINEEEPMRSVQTACLSMDNPSFPNGGMYGYCWLCTACDISKYYGGSNVDLDDAHALVHGTYAQGSHSKTYCTSGSFSDVSNIVSYYTQKTGVFISSPLSLSSVISEIQGSKPIASGWHYGNNKHMMVVCGYSYDNSTGVVAYIIKDSNYNEGYCYAYGMDNSSVVNYYINGNVYVWSESKYNWH